MGACGSGEGKRSSCGSSVAAAGVVVPVGGSGRGGGMAVAWRWHGGGMAVAWRWHGGSGRGTGNHCKGDKNSLIVAVPVAVAKAVTVAITVTIAVAAGVGAAPPTQSQAGAKTELAETTRTAAIGSAALTRILVQCRPLPVARTAF